MVREPTITVITKADPQAAVLALGGEMFPGQPGTVVATRSAFVRDNREAVAKLVALHVKAVDAVRNDKARAAKAAWEFIGKGLIEESVLTEALASPSSKFISDPRYIVEAAQRMQDFQTELGIPSSAAPAAQAFDYSFYDAVIGKVAELK
ncbi:ABC transporter substrate-binding protein [Methylogaea oryzae]|nr:ABC transporter substrate-binding protein [Methylogaea oryzae]